MTAGRVVAKTVVHFTDSRSFGGTEQVVLQHLAGVDRRYWRPALLHHPEPGLEPLLEGARRLQVPTRSVPRMETIRDLPRIPVYIRALRSLEASVLHCHLTWPLSCKYPLLASAPARVPATVATVHLYLDVCRRLLLRIQPRVIATQVDRYLAVSEAVAAKLRREFRIPAAKVRCIHNGIASSSFDRTADDGLRSRLGLEPARPIVLSVASLEPRKGQKYLIEAAAQVPEAALLLAGDGPDRNTLQEQASRLGVQDRVLFLGYRTDIPDLLSCCDVFVLPSFQEGLPLSILEAMAAAKPVIASAIQGNDEAVVDGQTGLLVPPGDAAALAAALRRLLLDLPLARRLGECGRIRAVEEYSVESMIQRTTEAYQELLSAPRKRFQG